MNCEHSVLTSSGCFRVLFAPRRLDGDGGVRITRGLAISIVGDKERREPRGNPKPA